ncbi:hypothetical protein PHYBOEH_000450 [Phytophthora boehmeriae]|uniref:RxLR effector protein n=1 Tax=Phytophthora boehmeriae TaxID=109152 RepID=A0A8T1X0Y5_9STRA|nr:hypothetical protein PHYBOEH_000450 [Phytophthora boehmeriae]
MALLIALCNGATTAMADSPAIGNANGGGKRYLRAEEVASLKDGDDEERLFGLGKLKSKFGSWKMKRSIASVTKKMEKAEKKEAKMIDNFIKSGKNPEMMKAELKIVGGAKNKYSEFLEKFTKEYNKRNSAIVPV